jgi:hypothetical protein
MRFKSAACRRQRQRLLAVQPGLAQLQRLVRPQRRLLARQREVALQQLRMSLPKRQPVLPLVRVPLRRLVSRQRLLLVALSGPELLRLLEHQRLRRLVRHPARAQRQQPMLSLQRRLAPRLVQARQALLVQLRPKRLAVRLALELRPGQVRRPQPPLAVLPALERRQRSGLALFLRSERQRVQAPRMPLVRPQRLLLVQRAAAAPQRQRPALRLLLPALARLWLSVRPQRQQLVRLMA